MFKRYPNTDSRQIIDYNRFLELTGEKVFICLDRGILEIAKYFLNSRALWATTYSVENTDYGYITPSGEQMDFLAETIAEANIDMSTCDEIVTALEGIKSAIESGASTSNSSGCCVGDGGTDITDIQDPPPASEPSRTGDPPPGYSSWDEFDVFKCNAIGWFLDGYIGTLRNWGGLFGAIGGITLAVIVGLTLFELPLVVLVTAMAAIGSIVGVDIGLLINFSTIAGDLEGNRDDLLCQLYGVGNADDAFDIISDAVESSISGLTLPPGVDTFFSIACTQLISTDLLNVIYTGEGNIDGHTGEGCSACNTPADCLSLTYGFIYSIENATGYDGVIHAHLASDGSSFGCEADDYCLRIETPCQVDVHIVPATTPGDPGTCDIYYVYDVMGSTVQWSGNTWIDSTVPSGGGFYIFASADVDIDIYFTNS